MKDRNGKELEKGQQVWVHPAIRPDGTKSIAKKKYKAEIVIANPWREGPELMTYVEDKHIARINDYLLSRLEVIG